MPAEDWWSTFFDPDAIFNNLGLHQIDGPVIDVGCGYGTFTLAIASRTTHPVIAIDIEPAMVNHTAAKAQQAGYKHVQCRLADITEDSFGVDSASVAMVLLFNLLHCENPLALLYSAATALRPGGKLAAIHWRSDIPTPRGPDLSIRPRPDELQALMIQAGLTIAIEPIVLPPYHYGLVSTKG